MVESFEELEAWQKARSVVNELRTTAINDTFENDYALLDQLRRAAYSIMLNIAEGFGRETDAEFRQYLIQARGSAREVQSILYIVRDADYFTEKQFSEFYAELDEIAKMLSGLIEYLDE